MKFTKALMGVFAGVLLLAGATTAQASTLSQAQVQAVIQLLQSFGADSGTIANVSASLGGYYGGGSSSSCTYAPAFTYNLYAGLTDAQTLGQISQLQRYLGVSPTGYFGSQTQQAVANFQIQHGIAPVTGGVGPITRSVLASLCQGQNQGGTQTSVPTIYSVSPLQGPVGTQVTISGTGFLSSNVVHFGSGGSMQVSSYNNGTLITYTIPTQVSGCDVIQTFAVCAQYVQLVTPGSYPLYVSNQNGQSVAQSFVVTSGAQQGDGSVQFISPASGQQYAHGQNMNISWSAPSAPTNASLILDLYAASGSKVGTIAIPQATLGSINWTIPSNVQNQACTLQYPNGLCGTNIPNGSYYLKATLTSNGFDPNATTYGIAQSGVFTINQ